ncbi:MAG: transcription antitermination factor NusB [Patescibacteria group bacterium]|nr:transcription antitermination factor NusB [Patescibacteria group bacterium]
MKVRSDPRHLNRIKLFKKLFTIGFPGKNSDHPLIQPIINNLPEIDKLIEKKAPEWPIKKLNKIDLAILRLAIYEIKIEKKAPNKVIVDEAVELAKKFGTEKTSKFVNGVLDSIIKK